MGGAEPAAPEPLASVTSAPVAGIVVWGKVNAAVWVAPKTEYLAALEPL